MSDFSPKDPCNTYYQNQLNVQSSGGTGGSTTTDTFPQLQPSGSGGGAGSSATIDNNLYYNPYSHPKPCPSCGACPTCGRGGYGSWPYHPYYPYITYTSGGTGAGSGAGCGSTSGGSNSWNGHNL